MGLFGLVGGVVNKTVSAVMPHNQSNGSQGSGSVVKMAGDAKNAISVIGGAAEKAIPFVL